MKGEKPYYNRYCPEVAILQEQPKNIDIKIPMDFGDSSKKKSPLRRTRDYGVLREKNQNAFSVQKQPPVQLRYVRDVKPVKVDKSDPLSRFYNQNLGKYGSMRFPERKRETQDKVTPIVKTTKGKLSNSGENIKPFEGSDSILNKFLREGTSNTQKFDEPELDILSNKEPISPTKTLQVEIVLDENSNPAINAPIVITTSNLSTSPKKISPNNSYSRSDSKERKPRDTVRNGGAISRATRYNPNFIDSAATSSHKKSSNFDEGGEVLNSQQEIPSISERQSLGNTESGHTATFGDKN